MVDFGYDISDFKDVDPKFGNLNDLMDLINAAHKLNLKVKQIYDYRTFEVQKNERKSGIVGSY